MEAAADGRGNTWSDLVYGDVLINSGGPAARGPHRSRPDPVLPSTVIYVVALSGYDGPFCLGDCRTPPGSRTLVAASLAAIILGTRVLRLAPRYSLQCYLRVATEPVRMEEDHSIRFRRSDLRCP